MRTYTLIAGRNKLDTTDMVDVILSASADVILSNTPKDDLNENAKLEQGSRINLGNIDYIRVKGSAGTTVSLFS